MPVEQRRAERRQEILDATRALFDERGVRDAQIEDISRAVGVNRAIIYRHFSGKEELFAETLVGYLVELEARLAAVNNPSSAPRARLEAITTSFLEFGQELPAFVDCAQALLRRQGAELIEEVSEATMLRLGQGMAANFTHVVRALKAGNESGEFSVPDPFLFANVLYAQCLGVLNLASFQIAVREHNPGLPIVDSVPFDQVVAYMRHSVVAMARGEQDQR